MVPPARRRPDAARRRRRSQPEPALSVRVRSATAGDADAVAALHAESWRRSYRGAYRDEYLDGDVFADRRAVWSERLRQPRSADVTILVEDDDGLVGFAHTILDDDPAFGALLDNLHVTPDRKRGGVGTLLMALTADAVLERRPASGLYLWVLEVNLAAQAFYAARGGRFVDAEPFETPGGGTLVGLRYVWGIDELTTLAAAREAR